MLEHRRDRNGAFRLGLVTLTLLSLVALVLAGPATPASAHSKGKRGHHYKPPTHTPPPPAHTPPPPAPTPPPPPNTPPPVACNNSSNSGGQGVTTTVHELGQASGTFSFTYQAFSVPDRFDVIYEGAVIYTTGQPVSGGATVPITYSGASTQVTVVVTGPSGTAWNYLVACPGTSAA